MYRIGTVEYGGELYHHGIKGMKWGVRRTPEQLGHRTSNRSASSNKDSGSSKKRIKIRSVSDEDLRKATERKKRENDYRAEVLRTKEIKDKYKGASAKAQSKNSVRIAKINANKSYKQAVVTTFINNVLGTTIKEAFGFGAKTVSGVLGIGKVTVQSFFNSTW